MDEDDARLERNRRELAEWDALFAVASAEAARKREDARIEREVLETWLECGPYAETPTEGA